MQPFHSGNRPWCCCHCCCCLLLAAVGVAVALSLARAVAADGAVDVAAASPEAGSIGLHTWVTKSSISGSRELPQNRLGEGTLQLQPLPG